MIRVPLTLTKGLGVFRVIGASLDPKPAAIKIALLARYGSKDIRPSFVILLSLTKPVSVNSFIILFTVPRE